MEPIPVFAEMGSINPVFLLPEKLKTAAVDVAKMFAASVTLGVGQFCTNPGLVIALEGEPLEQFIAAAGEEISKFNPAKMLHPGIAKAYEEKKQKALGQKDVIMVAEGVLSEQQECGTAALATVPAKTFLSNNVLH